MSKLNRHQEVDQNKPRVTEADLHWIEGMRYADLHRRRSLHKQQNDPQQNAQTYENLMNMALEIHGRLNAKGRPCDEAELRFATALAGRKFDPSCLRKV